MPGRWMRTSLLALATRAAGSRLLQGLERRIAGGRAVAVRSRIAQRAVMAHEFQQLKQRRQGS